MCCCCRGHPPRPAADDRGDGARIRHQPRRDELQLAALRRGRGGACLLLCFSASLFGLPSCALPSNRTVVTVPTARTGKCPSPSLTGPGGRGGARAVADDGRRIFVLDSDMRGCRSLTTVSGLPCVGRWGPRSSASRSSLPAACVSCVPGLVRLAVLPTGPVAS